MLQPVEQNHRRENSPAPLRPACDKWRPGLVAPIGDRLARADPSGQEKWPLNPESGADPQRGELIAERRHRRWQNRALPTLPLVIATPIVFSCRLSAPCSHRPELLPGCPPPRHQRSEEHTSELQSRGQLVCRLLLAKKKENRKSRNTTST